MNNTQKEKLISLFEDVFADTYDLDARLQQEDSATYDDEISGALNDEGFPTDPKTKELVNAYIEVTSAVDENAWVEQFESDYDLQNTSSDDIDASITTDSVTECIIGHTEMTRLSVIIEDDLEEFLDENPSEAFFIDTAMKEFDIIGLNEDLFNRQYDDFPENIQSQIDDAVADELGSDANPRDVDIYVRSKGEITESDAEYLYQNDYELGHSMIDYFNSPQPVIAIIESGNLKVDVTIEE